MTLLVVSTLLFACSTPVDNSEKNIKIIEDYIAAVEELNSEAMDQILDDSYIGYGPSYNNEINKDDAIANWKNYTENLYKSIDYKKSRTLAVKVPDGENKGEWVTNWAELHIIYKESDAEVTIWANTLYQIENEKIIKSYTIYNEADALFQLGYTFINENE